MKLEPKPALQATLYLVLLAVVIALEIILPGWVTATIILPLALGVLWWLLYIAFRELGRLHAKTIEARKASQEAQREADQLKQEKKEEISVIVKFV